MSTPRSSDADDTSVSRPASTRRRTVGFLWGLVALGVVLGVAGISGPVGAADGDGSGSSAVKRLVVQQVDARSNEVVVDGNLVGAEASTLSATVGDDKVDARVVGASDLPLDAVVVLDNAASLGNGTVQLAKNALTPLLPGAGVVDRLALVTTGGGAEVETGLTDSADAFNAALDPVAPDGGSELYRALQRAGEILETSGEGRARAVILFAAAAPAGGGTMGEAEAAIRRAYGRLDVVAMPRGVDVSRLAGMVAGLGGYLTETTDEEKLDSQMQKVATELGGRFRMTFAAPEGTDGDVDLTVRSGSSSTSVQYVDGSIRTGSDGLAPVVRDRSLLDRLVNNSVMMWIVVLLGVGAVVLAAWTLLSMLMPDENNLDRRLKVYEDPYGSPEEQEAEPSPAAASVTVPILRRAVDFTGDIAEKRGLLEKLEGDLERANLPLRAAEALFFVGAGSLLVTVLVGLLTRNPVLTIGAAALAFFLPKALLNMRVRRRQKAFEAQLPDMLALMAGTLRAGYSIGQGFEAVSKEIDDPMGRELRRVVTENRLGRPLDEALEAVAERMQSDDFSWAVMAIRIQREVGGNLAELLLTVANTMTQRERLRRDVATLTAEGRISAIVLGFLPPALGVVMWVMNPDYMGKLFQPGLGYILLGVSLVSMIIGFLWMKKIITIEV